ncbi:ubiquitin carboxyl-terminal hydrolase 40 isoform X1 [Peromyscus californicus insignis]|uniref:ubiquitin carboxyl-terminal hydrolase 40 isoform X1 n=3 Tax=Peromyscus californicus insignis TaxID=564181 RepID=UPI0022A6ED5F|nr:ubiquitin carboxyl-terminal hydrolase 40 isoform X1 [Peromyscus californicus insignis]XP_052606445.1 ubiquitin carboxyl-terminal hydrolase 40 isoform X1 [Peromyscus californicus insignis]
MFGSLFEEDYSSVSNSQYGKGKKLKTKGLEPPAPREVTNLSGIRNQGGTCYLNSLLQTLHFTPEFREALFSLGPEELGSLEDKDKPDAKVRIIPLQLQRLFAQLLLLDQEAASTIDLTDSFGWTSEEEMRQHDVQELNRILFSALETSLVGTSGHDLINRLYHGTIVNQIICKECKNISEKQEDFLDLTVAVKNVSGLEDALWNMYVEEEVFDCDNLYHCGTCDRLVKAAKSAKLRKLPPFLTISLLRFNFDFVKCERYKETSCYTFPLRINLKPFCEQSELDDTEYMYDLFSVIIHKGGCYGGHYHVYIKDVDHLGNWQCQEEINDMDVHLKDLQNEEEADDPLMILKTILLQEETNQIPVDQLGQKLLKKTGISWNKKYRKQHGPLRKFLQLHPQMFLLSTDESTVSLLKSHFTQAPSDLQRNQEQILHTLASEPPGLSDNTSYPHWFDINDSKVQPIRENAIAQQFQGKESAYMLFYRKAKLQRPSEARANPRYRVPCHLLKEMDAANIQLHMRRAECDSANNNFELHLHLGPHYRFFNGALHPEISQTESVWDLTFDKRKTLGDLRQSIFQLLEFWEGDMVLSVAKRVPAGLHVYHTLDGDELTLCEAEIADGEDIFVWNGVEVGGVQIQTGSDCEPLLIHILHLEMSGEEGSKCEQLVESPHVFPASAEVGTVFTALTIPVGVLLTNSVESADEECWTAIPKEDMKKTFREQGLRNGSLILVQDADSDDNSLLPRQGRWTSSVDELNWLQVKNLCQLESEEEQVQIAATMHTVVFDIRIKAIKELKLMKELAENSCLRPIDRNGKLLCPVPDAWTLEEAEVKMGSSLGLCLGKAPTSSQLFLFFALASDIHPGAEMEVIVEETLSVRDCLKIMLEKSGQQGERWHLRKMDWCYEAGEPLCEEDATLKELMICSGDTLLLTEGELPPLGFLKVPIWWYQPARLSGLWESRDHSNCASPQGSSWASAPSQGAPGPETADVTLLYLGDVEISEEATLVELKSKAMALTSLSKLAVQSPALLRVWTVESKRPSRLLRIDRRQLKEYRLGRRAELCLELLQKEEDLGPRDVLLRTQLRIPGERAYTLALDLVWDTTRGWTAGSLRQRVADFYSLPVEKIEIAKYFPEKFEWLPISSWNQQVAKRKKKKNQDTLQGGPYYLKDGDTIGIKNLLFDDDDDFSTIRDDIGKENQKQLALEKKKSREVLRAQSSDVFSSAEMRTRPRGPEASLSIHVASFR